MPMFKLLAHSRTLLQKLLPCQLCGSAAQQKYRVCADCLQQLPWLKANVYRQETEIQVACHYRYPVDRMIQQFKYEQQLHYQSLLAGSLCELTYPRVQAIVPMPVATKRLAERGYHHTLLLAQVLARHLQLPIWQPVVRRHQHSQKGLSRLERLENLDQQFQLRPDAGRPYRRVLIVDDVVTTGSSIRALKQQLEQLGCHKVYAVCIASADG